MNQHAAQASRMHVPNAGEAHAHFAAAPVANLADLTSNRPIMVIAPHADDETLGCGGLIALAAREGMAVTVIVMTDGTRAHLNSRQFDSDARRDMREAEVRAAVDKLAGRRAKILFLRQPDGFLKGAGDEADRLVDQLELVAQRTGAASVFVTWAADPHPDHAAAAALVQTFASRRPTLAIFAYPIWGLTLGPCEPILTAYSPAVRLEIRSVLDVKRRAIACFASQLGQIITDDPDGFQLDAADLARFTGDFETFIDLRSEPRLSSVPTEHFEALYRKSADPWQYVDNSYEQGRFSATLASLPDAHYRSACEIGCSIGVLTRMLADRCDEIVGIDCSAKAIEQAELRLAFVANAKVRLMRVPQELPDSDFDLIVLSEVLYFFSQSDLAGMADFVGRKLRAGGTCILVNFLGDTESPLSGEEAADRFVAMLPEPMCHISLKRFEGFRIDVLKRKTQVEVLA